MIARHEMMDSPNALSLGKQIVRTSMLAATHRIEPPLCVQQ